MAINWEKKTPIFLKKEKNQKLPEIYLKLEKFTDSMEKKTEKRKKEKKRKVGHWAEGPNI